MISNTRQTPIEDDRSIGPKRPLIHSKAYLSMNGYRPNRSDFETEYLNNFEFKFIADLDYDCHITHADSLLDYKDLNNVSPQSPSRSLEKCDETEYEDEVKHNSETETKLKLQILKAYNELIKERYERKRFVREFGLLNEIVINEKVGDYLKVSREINTSDLDTFKPMFQSGLLFPLKFMRFFATWSEHLKFIELLKHQIHLLKKLKELKEYRQNGIKFFRHVNVFKKLKSKRLNRTPTMHMASLMTAIGPCNHYTQTASFKLQCTDWFKRFVATEKNIQINSTNNSVLKYKHVPLKIESYPDCEKLNEEEKEFCRITRIQPTVFLRVKAILIIENSKAGFCTYSRARKIAGIDVNKTRLIHNHLLKMNLLKLSS
jgi:hypothetical protein